MNIIPPAPTSFCPTCGLEGDGFVRIDQGIHLAHYLCPANHGWQLKWADLEVSA